MTSFQLNEIETGTASASGSLTLTFPAARLNRTLQGSVTVAGSAPGTVWSVLVGGQQIGTLFAPGPFGPVQILSGQSLSVSAIGTLAPGQAYSATVQGIDDPAATPSPYSGPVSVTFPGVQGGLLMVRNNNIFTNGSILPSPPSGVVYRIQSAVVAPGATSAATAGGEIELYSNSSAGVQAMLFWQGWLTGQLPGGTFLFNGLLVDGPIDAVATSGTGITIFVVSLFYDLVALSS